MSQINDLVDSLTTTCGTFLGASFSELKFKHKIEDNTFKGSNNKYGVIAQNVVGTSGATCFVTVDQTFDIELTNSYITTVNGDSSKDNARIALQDISLNLYTEIVNTKAGSPSIVMNILDLTSELSEIEEDKIIVNKLSFTITYRKAL